MIDMIYNLRVGDIHAAEFSGECGKLCIPFENSLSEEQIEVFHKILDCVSDTTAADESRLQGRVQGRNVFDERDLGMSI